MKLLELAVDQIDPPHHAHRVSFDEPAMLELAADIDANGLQSPIKVRPSGERYEIIYGMRRWEAHRRLRRLTIAAFIDTHADDAATEQARFSENMKRSDLTAMEEAHALERAMLECGITPDNMARMLHRSRPWIDGRLALLTLQPDLQDALHARAISTGAALALADVDEPAHRTYLLEHAQRNGASISVIRAWVADYRAQRAAHGPGALPAPDPSRPPAAAVILIECLMCHEQRDHTQLHIARICTECLTEIQRCR
ncbi:MAG: ParB/RepB/Spo0J family partition protein [Burkholderiales bacterium]